ncbi:MAG: GGDEF domain-containing response regulator [Pseudanabaenaceae cyanobacterium]
MPPETAPFEPTVLIVDDNDNNRSLLARQLRRLGYTKLLMAQDGEEALAAIASHGPDLVLLDIQMPRMDGYEVLAVMKEQGWVVPTIAISALDEIDSVVRCIELGAEDYLTKPFEKVLLKARVQSCLEKKRLRDREVHYLRELEAANRRLSEMVHQDGLTGIPNRRFFDTVLAQALTENPTEPLSLIVFDIDYFKQFNDRYGHLQGDDCLRRVAAAAVGSTRAHQDTVARYGGEEFAVVLPNTDAAEAAVIAERIRQAIADLRIPHSGSQVADHVTISLGFTTDDRTPPQKTVVEVIAQADQALYQAKGAGRNRAIRYDGDS